MGPDLGIKQEEELMSKEGAQAVFGVAVTDSTFCRELLDCPARAIEGFDLSTEEFEALAQIRAENLQQFAAKFERWRLSKAVARSNRPAAYYRDVYAGDRIAV